MDAKGELMDDLPAETEIVSPMDFPVEGKVWELRMTNWRGMEHPRMR